MQRISVDMATEDMVLAKAVQRENGAVLMGEGTELNSNLIERLKNLDIQTITVRGHPIDTGVEEKPIEQLLSELEDRFAHVSSDNLCVKIKELIIKDIKIRREENDI